MHTDKNGWPIVDRGRFIGTLFDYSSEAVFYPVDKYLIIYSETMVTNITIQEIK